MKFETLVATSVSYPISALSVCFNLLTCGKGRVTTAVEESAFIDLPATREPSTAVLGASLR